MEQAAEEHLMMEGGDYASIEGDHALTEGRIASTEGGHVLTGGRLLASGAYGCVFIPPLRCEGEETTYVDYKGERTVDKLMTEDQAEKEMTVSALIRSRMPLWKNYVIVATSICTPAPKHKQVDPDYSECSLIEEGHLKRMKLLRMRYGGTPLQSYRMDFQSHSFFDFVTHLLEGVALLSLSRIVHMDLHMGNILVDSANVPRIIDVNLSVDVRNHTNLLKRLTHVYSPVYMQESPDNAILVGAQQGISGQVVINDIMRFKSILVTVRSVLGISEREQRASIEAFYKSSPVAQRGDIVAWFSFYWRLCDSWAIGCGIVWLISRLNLWKSFVEGPYALYQANLIKVLRRMCEMNPKKRIDAVQALAMLDPDNFVVRTYGKKWLTIVDKFTS